MNTLKTTENTTHFHKSIILPFLVLTTFLLSVFFNTSDNKTTLSYIIINIYNNIYIVYNNNIYIYIVYIYSLNFYLLLEFLISSFISWNSSSTLFIKRNSSWLIFQSIKDLGIKTTLLFNLDFANDMFYYVSF